MQALFSPFTLRSGASVAGSAGHPPPPPDTYSTFIGTTNVSQLADIPFDPSPHSLFIISSSQEPHHVSTPQSISLHLLHMPPSDTLIMASVDIQPSPVLLQSCPTSPASSNPNTTPHTQHVVVRAHAGVVQEGLGKHSPPQGVLRGR